MLCKFLTSFKYDSYFYMYLITSLTLVKHLWPSPQNRVPSSLLLKFPCARTWTKQRYRSSEVHPCVDSKNILPFSCYPIKPLQNFDCQRRQSHNMRGAGFRNQILPFSLFQIDVRPFRFPELSGTDKRIDEAHSTETFISINHLY